MAAHSKLGASSSHRWMECPGSVRLSADAPNTSSAFAMEGNAAHDLAEMCLKEQLSAFDYIGASIKIEDSEFIVNEEMIEAVDTYLEAIEKDREPGDELYVEHRFDLSKIYPGMFGTADCVLLQPKSRTLRVYDFKYGAGIAVEVERNPQAMYYGVGAALAFKGFENIELVIVQPRAIHKEGPVRRWKTDVMELMDFIGELQIAAQKTEDPSAILKAGEHCKFCPAKGFCPELRKTAEKNAMVEFTPAGTNTPPAPNFLTPEQVNQILRDADVVENWIAAVREYAHSTLANGGSIPTWKLVAKRANKVWSDELDAAMLLSDLGVPEDRIYKKKIISPSAAEKLLPKATKKQIEPLVQKGVSSGTTLAREEDPRPAVVASAESEFGPVK
jgi:hypothetical protein